MRTLERLINLLGWPAIGFGLAHALFGGAPAALLGFVAAGIGVGIVMPSLLRGRARPIGTAAQPFDQAGVERPADQERA